MMVPSLSTSISSPSFFKNREGELNDQEQDGDIDHDNVNNNVEGGVDDQGTISVGGGGGGGGGNGFGDLNDLLIPSLNIPELLDELNQHSDTCSNNSLGQQQQQQQTNILSNSSNSNKSTTSIGSGKKSLGYQIYRTFPYRGSLPSPLMQIINQLGGEEGGASAREESGGGEEDVKTKPKPCSTNALRHSRQYKGLQLNLPPSDVNTIDIITNPSRKSQELKALSPRSGQVLDSSFFQPPPPQQEQQKERNVNVSLEVQIDDLSIRGSVSSISYDMAPSNNNTNNNDHVELRESSSKSKWSELIQSLASTEEEVSQDKSLMVVEGDLDLDSLKNLSLEGISLEFDAAGSGSPNSNHNLEEFDQKALSSISLDLLPPSPIESTSPSNTSSNNNNDKNSTSSLSPIPTNDNSSVNNSPPVQSNPISSSSPPLFIDSRTNACRIKGPMELNNADSSAAKKKQGLSRTITFADSESIHHFFGDPTAPQKPFEPKQQHQPPPQAPTVSERDRPGRISLSSLFPKLPFNSNNNPSSLPSNSNAPSKFYYPLLQPQPATLLRGFASKADTNIRGLKRAKKNLDMEDEWLTMHPFGDDPQMALFAIFDGHSGKNCAVAAKEILPNVLLKYIQTAKKECGGKNIYDMRGVFLSTFKETDALLSKFEYEGSTATIVLIWRVGEQRFLQSANVGDSSSFLSYAGETLTLTKDHRVTDPEEQQRIRDDGVELGENQTRINGLMVSRAMGDHFIKHLNCGLSGEPTISPPISLTPFHSHLIVASDGLWDVISGNRAMEMIKTEQSEEKMANLLLQCALKSIKSKDNISIIVSTL